MIQLDPYQRGSLDRARALLAESDDTAAKVAYQLGRYEQTLSRMVALIEELTA